MARRAIVLGVVTAGLAFVLAAPARAQTFDKLAYLTFSHSVQVPGVTLVPGTYRFRVADTTTSRNVIQVLSYDGKAVYSMFTTIPDSRMTITDDPMVTFQETPVGVVPAIRSLFEGGETRGYEFVWWKPVDMTVATTAQPAVIYTPIAGAPGPEPLAFKPEPPARGEAAAVVEPAPAIARAKPAAEVAVEESAIEPAADELAATASALPLIALIGLGAMATGLGARRLRRNFN